MSTGFDWGRCSHEGIGMPGCETCDPIEKHQIIRLKFELAEARDLLSVSEALKDFHETNENELRAQLAALVVVGE